MAYDQVSQLAPCLLCPGTFWFLPCVQCCHSCAHVRTAAALQFSCQWQLFYRGKSGLWYDPVFKVSTASSLYGLQT